MKTEVTMQQCGQQNFNLTTVPMAEIYTDPTSNLSFHNKIKLILML